VKVLFDHQVFSYQTQGGVSRSFAELMAGLEGLGHEVVRGWKWSPNAYLAGRDLWGSLSFRGKAQLRSLLNGRTSRSRLLGSFDLFHPTYFDPYFLPLLQGRPFVLTIHDMTHELFPETLVDTAVVQRRKQLLAPLAAHVITVSENTKADAVRLLGLNPGRVTAIAHGNNLRPGRVAAETSALRGYWLYVGSRHGYKDFAVVVKALGLRQAAQRGESLLLVGGGAVTPSERALLDAHGLKDAWRQISCSDAQLAGYYSHALGLVYPSRYEGFGLPLLEAMAWGCPVVAANASSLPEVGGEAALYFEPGSHDQLAARLGELDDPERRDTLVEAGREREAHYTWEKTVQATIQVYQAVLEARR